MNKSYISIMLLLIIGVATIGTISARYWSRGYGRYNYAPYYGGYGRYYYDPYYYDDSGAAIAGSVIGGLSGIVGAGIAASEARKAREQEERLAQLERREYEQKMTALEEPEDTGQEYGEE